MVWPPCFSLSHICPSMSRCSKNCETQSSNFGSGERHPAVHANRARWLHGWASPTSSGQWPTPIRGRSGSRAIRSGARGRARIRAPRVSRRVTTREAVFAFWGFARIHLPVSIYARRQGLRAGFKAILGVIRSGADRRLAPAMIYALMSELVVSENCLVSDAANETAVRSRPADQHAGAEHDRAAEHDLEHGL
jgi:hypothetical protein